MTEGRVQGGTEGARAGRRADREAATERERRRETAGRVVKQGGKMADGAIAVFLLKGLGTACDTAPFSFLFFYRRPGNCPFGAFMKQKQLLKGVLHSKGTITGLP